MSVKSDNIDIQNICLGSTPIQGVYLGSQQIWGNTQLSSFEVYDYYEGTSATYNFEKGWQWAFFIISPYNTNNIFSTDTDGYVLYKSKFLEYGPFKPIHRTDNIDYSGDYSYSIG